MDKVLCYVKGRLYHTLEDEELRPRGIEMGYTIFDSKTLLNTKDENIR